MAIPALTTEIRVKQRLSTHGVNLRTDHFPAGALTECILSASCDVAAFLSRYPLQTANGYDGLDASDVVSTWTADVAVYHLCRLRANPIPDSVQARFDWIMERLQKIQDGEAVIPDIASSNTAPAVSNYQIDYGTYPSKRRSTRRSYPQRPTGWPSYTDRPEPPPYPSG